MTLCPDCNQKLIEYKILKEDGTSRDIYIHPETTTKCEYKDDGVEVRIMDEFMMNKFQEIIKESGIKEIDISPLKEKEEVSKSEPTKKVEDKLDILKTRLCKGFVSVNEFDEVLKRVKE